MLQQKLVMVYPAPKEVPKVCPEAELLQVKVLLVGLLNMLEVFKLKPNPPVVAYDVDDISMLMLVDPVLDSPFTVVRPPLTEAVTTGPNSLQTERVCKRLEVVPTVQFWEKKAIVRYLGGFLLAMSGVTGTRMLNSFWMGGRLQTITCRLTSQLSIRWLLRPSLGKQLHVPVEHPFAQELPVLVQKVLASTLSSKKMPIAVAAMLQEGRTPPPIRTIMGILTPLLQGVPLPVESQQFTQAALMFCSLAPVMVYPLMRQQETIEVPCLKISRKSSSFGSAQMGLWQPVGRMTSLIAITAAPWSLREYPVNMLHSEAQLPVQPGLGLQELPHSKLYIPYQLQLFVAATMLFTLWVGVLLLYFSQTIVEKKQGEPEMLQAVLPVRQPTKSRPLPAPELSKVMTPLLKRSSVVKWVAALPPAEMSAVPVLSRKSSCCETPRSGMTPTEELEPWRKPCMALAVEESVWSSQQETTCALPILQDPVLWQPAVSRSSLLVSTLVDWPARSVQSTGVRICAPVSSQTTGAIETAAKEATGLEVADSKKAFPETKQRKAVLMKAPTFLQTRRLLAVSQEQWTLWPVKAGRLWATVPSATPVAPSVTYTMYSPAIGEVSVKLKPMLKELQGRMFGVALSALNSGSAVVIFESVKVLSMPQRRRTRGETVLIAILLTLRALFWRPFSRTLPEINSVQQPLTPLTEWQAGLLIEVEILIVCPPVTDSIANVIFDRSEEIVQKSRTAALPPVMAADWQSPMKEKSMSEVPVFMVASVLSQQMKRVKFPPVVLEAVGVRQMSKEQIEAGTVACVLEELQRTPRFPLEPRGASMSTYPKAMFESQTMLSVRQLDTAITWTRCETGVVLGFLVGQICTSYQVLACIAYPRVTCRMVAERESTTQVAVAT